MHQQALPIFPEPDIVLMHGDCLEVMLDIEDGSIDMVMADPPYGTTACKWDSIIPLEPMWKELKRLIKPNGAIVLMGSQPFTTTLISSNIGMFKYEWIWEKSRPTGTMQKDFQPFKIHENILVFYSKTPAYSPIKYRVDEKYRDKRKSFNKVANTEGRQFDSFNRLHSKDDGWRFPQTILSFDSVWVKGMHPTQKPVALMEYLIKTYTNEGDTVLDFCMGSGTTGIACRNLNRNFIGIEKDLECFKIAENRIDINA